MSKENLDQFFEEFKTVRKSKKLSINDVAKATKLQKEYIKAIESGNFDISKPINTGGCINKFTVSEQLLYICDSRRGC